MSDSSPFRVELLRRLLKATGATSAGIAMAASCGGKTSNTDQVGVVDMGQTGGALTSAGGAFANAGGGPATGAVFGAAGTIEIEPRPTDSVRYCLGQEMPLGSDGGHPIDAGASRDAGRRLDAAVASIDAGRHPDARAIPTDAAQCPPVSELAEQLGIPCDGQNEWRVVQASDPKVIDNACCYDTVLEMNFCGYVGRAFLVDEGFLKATSRPGGGWRTGSAPDVGALSGVTRRALASAWEKDGLFEHASVATFSRFAIQLLSVGAPSYLLHDTLSAGDDEIRHAELCFALASAYHGAPLEPDDFPIGDQLPLDRDLASIVAETVVEGCIGETLAAVQAEAQLRLAKDPAVIAALEATVEDETRHAELAWRVVAWAIREGGERVRETAARTFAAFRPPAPPAIDLSGVNLQAFAEHGRLTPAEARAAALVALERVVRPCAAALLERDVVQRRPATALFV